MKQITRIALVTFVLIMAVLSTAPTQALTKLSGELTIRFAGTTVHCMTADRAASGYTSGMVVSDDPNMPTLPATCDQPLDTTKIVKVTITSDGTTKELSCDQGFIPTRPDACRVK